MSARKARVTVTVDPYLAAYAESLVEAGKAASFSEVFNDALAERVGRDRRVTRRWKETLSRAAGDDRAAARRMRAHADAQLARFAAAAGE